MLASQAIPAPLRFWALVDKSGECWLWKGAVSAGYGRFGVTRRKSVRAHRYSFELANGVIPQGLQIDHVCRVRHCVNPKHLEAVTQQENIRRGEAGIQWRRKTHCPQHHEYTPENTYYAPKTNYRSCRACRRKE